MRYIDHTAGNEHIGKMAAVTPHIIHCELVNYYPAGKCLEAATSPICHHVRCKRRTARWKMARNQDVRSKQPDENEI